VEKPFNMGMIAQVEQIDSRARLSAFAANAVDPELGLDKSGFKSGYSVAADLGGRK